MRLVLLGACSLAVALGSCGKQGSAGTQGGVSPFPATSRAAPQPSADPTILAIKAKLEQVLPTHGSCRLGLRLESYETCRNFRVMCVREMPVSDADVANGIARKMIFVTTSISRNDQSVPWQDRTIAYDIDVDPSGSFAEKYEGSGTDDMNDCNWYDAPQGKVTIF